MLQYLQLSICLFLTLAGRACQSQTNDADNLPSFKELLVEIRERQISPRNAESKFKRIISNIRTQYPNTSTYDSLDMNLVFPLKMKNYRSVGGRGKGYYDRHFNLFDHSEAKSHPAHDIFIYDLDKDCKDDIDNDYVDVLAVNKGVVIATEKEWKEETEFKGGNYVWLYDFESGGLWYYAHLRKVGVVEGQLVEQGDKLGEVGRTGFNAETNRSDTHVHLMYLKIKEDLSPEPVNHYPWLRKAKTVYTTQLPSHYPRKTISATLLSPKSPNILSFGKFKSVVLHNKVGK